MIFRKKLPRTHIYRQIGPFPFNVCRW